MEKGAYRNNFCRIEDEDEDERMRMMIMRMKIRIMRMETISPTMTYLSRWWRMHWNNFGRIEDDDDDERMRMRIMKMRTFSITVYLTSAGGGGCMGTTLAAAPGLPPQALKRMINIAKMMRKPRVLKRKFSFFP